MTIKRSRSNETRRDKPINVSKRQKKVSQRARTASFGLSGNDITLYGYHAVLAALKNEARQVKRLLVTEQAAGKLYDQATARGVDVEHVSAHDLERITGPSAVHQGMVMIVKPLEGGDIHDADAMSLIVVLDQIIDPHNVGAIIRSAVALGAQGLIVTHRNSPRETGLMAKIASGGLEHMTMIEVGNLAQAIDKLKSFGFLTIGLDSEGSAELSQNLYGDKIALVLGAEGKGLRRLTRERCDALARLTMPGAIKSLNVSNAAALALYITHSHLTNTKEFK